MCCKIHNLVINHTEIVTVPKNKPPNANGAVMEVLRHDECVCIQGTRRGRETSTVKVMMTEFLKEFGLERPT